MRAIWTDAPGSYRLTERPLPSPGPGEALVRVGRAALCHTDVIIRQGKAKHVAYPVTPGHEFSGVVEALGPGVRNLKAGDRVTVHTLAGCGACHACREGDTIGCRHISEYGSMLNGGFAEYSVIAERFLFRIPDHVSLDEAALIEPLANAVSAARSGSIRQGDRVVVIGPGPIGLMALQVARLRHPSALVLIGTRDERIAFGNRFGATHLCNIRHEGAIERVREHLRGRGREYRCPGADVVIDCSGTREGLEMAMDLIGWRGRVIVEGILDAEDRVSISPLDMLGRAARIEVVCGWTTQDFTEALQMVASGLVDLKSLITHRFPLEKWEEAFDLITKRKSESIKVQFSMTPD